MAVCFTNFGNVMSPPVLRWLVMPSLFVPRGSLEKPPGATVGEPDAVAFSSALRAYLSPVSIQLRTARTVPFTNSQSLNGLSLRLSSEVMIN